MNQLPKSYSLSKRHINPEDQKERLKQAYMKIEDYEKYMGYFSIIKDLIDLKCIVFDNVYFEVIHSFRYMCISFAMRIHDRLANISFVPMLLQFHPVINQKLQLPRIHVVTDGNYYDMNSKQLIEQNVIYRKWKDGDRYNECGIKELIQGLHHDFSTNCPIYMINAPLLNENDLTDIQEVNELDTVNKGYYGYYGPTRVFIKEMKNNSKVSRSIFREFSIHSSLHHRNIIEFIGYYIKNNTTTIVTKCADCSLSSFLQRKPDLSILQKKYILYSIAYGLAYLHYHSIIHHDLKLTNILIDGNDVKLCDFGSSYNLNENTYVSSTLFGIGNKLHKSPACQELNTQDQNERKRILMKEDIYAFGIIMMEVLLGEEEVKNYWEKHGGGFFSNFTIPSSLERDQVLYSILQDCFKDYRNRPNIDSIAKRIYDWTPTLSS